ncbi:peptide chain release factor 1 [bacterium]|nr:peptide chain release factor 1 [bacterium]
MAISNPYKNVLNKIEERNGRKAEIEKMMEDAAILTNQNKLTDLSREHRQITGFLKASAEFVKITNAIEGAREILAAEEDAEMLEMAQVELDESLAVVEDLEQEVKLLLIPKDPSDDKSAMMEIRAGTGGDEAALFAGNLYRMYSKFIENHGWKTEILSSSPTELGGFKEVILSISGDGAFGLLKYESGVHRVQRVPATETSGRIHTSAASVVVLPEAEEVDIEIHQNDLRIDVYRSSGPGGQSVNTTDSAVRITHIPTGMVVTCQDEKSQHKNKAKALKVLRARLYDIKRKEDEAKAAASRRSVIGSGDRSAKIRTFNYPQGRVTDHRINLTLFRLHEILAGDLDELVEAMKMADLNEKLKAGAG